MASFLNIINDDKLYTLSEQAKKNQLISHAKYDKEHCRKILLKLNKKHDADILKKLDEVGNKQGYIKSLIRADLGINA